MLRGSQKRPFGSPVDRDHWVDWRQIGIGLPCVVVDGAQAPHRPIGYIGAILLTDLVVAVRYELRLPSEPSERLV
jgi:hypothetical protein